MKAIEISDWINDLTPEHLPIQYQLMAREIGMENTIKIANLFQGTGFYLPRLDKPLGQLRNQRIKEEFNGYNHKELAIKYGLTERWIYKILSREETEEIQESFFA